MKKDFYFVGAVLLFLILTYIWQIYRQISAEPFIFPPIAEENRNICKIIPNFNDHKVEPVRGIKNANFAGKYKVSTTTCGQFCEGYSITNLEKDETKELEIKSEVGASFASTSALFIINPPSDSAKALSYYPILTSFYEFDGGKLRFICKRPTN